MIVRAIETRAASVASAHDSLNVPKLGDRLLRLVPGGRSPDAGEAFLLGTSRSLPSARLLSGHERGRREAGGGSASIEAQLVLRGLLLPEAVRTIRHQYGRNVELRNGFRGEEVRARAEGDLLLQ